MDIGNRIKELRKIKGWTQKQLAEKANVAEITIRQYESRKRRPQIEQLQRIATVLDIDIIYLLNGYTASEWSKITEMKNLQQAKSSIIDDYINYEEYFTILNGEKLSDQVFLKTTKGISEQYLQDLLMDEFRNLNRLGQLRAIEYLAALTENPRFNLGENKYAMRKDGEPDAKK